MNNGEQTSNTIAKKLYRTQLSIIIKFRNVCDKHVLSSLFLDINMLIILLFSYRYNIYI